MAGFAEIVFPYHRRQRERFREGALVDEWAVRYSTIFDGDDVRLAKSQPSNHFFEWLAAVLLFEATGYLSLVEKYETHSGKVAKLRQVVPGPVFDHVMENRTGLPDLFVYAPDHSNWFFCEVKGAADRARKHQLSRAEGLEKACGKAVRLLWLKEQGL